MKIDFKTDSVLKIIQPDVAHKAQMIIFFCIGFLGSVGVIFSGERLINGIFFYVLLVMSFIWFHYGGDADSATFDKERNILEMIEYKSIFGKPVISYFRLTDIISCELNGTHFLNKAYRGSNRKSFAIILTFKDGKKICPLPYTNGKKKSIEVYQVAKTFLEK